MSEQKQSRRRPPVAAEFVELVREMRKAQRDYFAWRTPAYLRVAVAVEKKVDEFLAQQKVLELQWIQFSQGKKTDDVQMKYTVSHDVKTEEEPKT